MSVGKFSVDNAILVNMIMIIVFIVGVYTAYDIPKEEMPAVDMGAFYIIVSYIGVSPSEMEQLVVKKIEDEIYAILNLHLPVEIVKPNSLPRSEGKAKRVVEE